MEKQLQKIILTSFYFRRTFFYDLKCIISGILPKKRSDLYMQKIKLLLLLFSAFLILIGCAQKNNNNPPAANNTNPNSNEEIKSDDKATEDDVKNDADNEKEVSMMNFFLPNGSNAHFEGDGNEFAELRIEVTHIGDKFVVIDENNGGALIRKIYKVENKKIETLFEDAIDNDDPLPTKETISNLTVKEIYLQQPFEVGTKFNDWTIVETDGTIDTPYKKFENVIVIEMTRKRFYESKILRRKLWRN